MTKAKVLVTGASGYIASLILPGLRDRYDLTLLDVRTTDRNGQEVAGIQIADLIDTKIQGSAPAASRALSSRPPRLSRS